MGILDAFTKIERRIERLAERSDIPLQPIEIRKRIADEVEALVEPAGRGRRLLPFNWIGVTIAAPDPRRRAVLEAVLESEGGLQGAIEARLREAGCPVPAGFTVEASYVEAVGEREPTATGTRPYSLLCERRSQTAVSPARARRDATTATTAEARSSTARGEPAAGTARTASEAPAPAPPARLVVLRGEAAEPACLLTRARTNIGRLAEVEDKDRRIVRRNQLVFLDTESPVNQSVSRAQAHIAFAPPDEYRLFDDRSTYGTRLFRDGRTIAVPGGSPKGVGLQHGDEIYLGQAAVRFEIDEAGGSSRRSRRPGRER